MASKSAGKVAGKGIAAATDAVARKADWDRDQFSARLTPSRKALLRELASALPAGLSPVEVVDRAVEIALAKIAVEGRQAGRRAALASAADGSGRGRGARLVRADVSRRRDPGVARGGRRQP